MNNHNTLGRFFSGNKHTLTHACDNAAHSTHIPPLSIYTAPHFSAANPKVGGERERIGVFCLLGRVSLFSRGDIFKETPQDRKLRPSMSNTTHPSNIHPFFWLFMYQFCYSWSLSMTQTSMSSSSHPSEQLSIQLSSVLFIHLTGNLAFKATGCNI